MEIMTEIAAEQCGISLFMQLQDTTKSLSMEVDRGSTATCYIMCPLLFVPAVLIPMCTHIRDVVVLYSDMIPVFLIIKFDVFSLARAIYCKVLGDSLVKNGLH